MIENEQGIDKKPGDWIDEGDGMLRAAGPDEGGFSQNDSFTTQEFADFAEIQRSRWDLFGYIKTVIKVSRRRARRLRASVEVQPTSENR